MKTPPPAPAPGLEFPCFGLALAARVGATSELALLRRTANLRTAWLIVLDGNTTWDDGRHRRWLDGGSIVSCRPPELSATRFARTHPAFDAIVLGFSGDVAFAHARFLERRLGALQRAEREAAVMRLARSIVRDFPKAKSESDRERLPRGGSPTGIITCSVTADR